MDLQTFRFPTNIRFGIGARSALTDFAAAHDVKRPLLVTDGGLPLTEAYGLISDEMERAWSGAWYDFSGAQPNPLEQDVTAAWRAYANGDCDGIIGLGGGSAMDVAKTLRPAVAFPEVPLAKIDWDRLPEKLTPMCAIPTTAGTGSEVGRSAVITMADSGNKAVLGAKEMMPELAILDAELTVGLPARLTAATGMDAMTHAIEAYVCPMFHPMCDAIALEAVRLVREYLPRAVADGGDLEARGRMLIAASMGAVAFQKDLGAAHSLAHPQSTEFGVHHGLANALVLPAVVRFNGETDSQQYARVADALMIDGAGDPAAAVADFLESFIADIGITGGLSAAGVSRESLPQLAKKAFADPCHQTNPRKCTEADLLRLYEQAW